MMSKSFPWGVYVADILTDDGDIPLLIDSNKGGVLFLSDDSSRELLIDTVESIALSLLEVMPLGSISIDVFSYGAKSFLYLSTLEKASLYKVAYSPQKANMLFDELEELALYRQHSLLDFNTPTLNEYNQTQDEIEPYKLLLINLDDFPEDMTSVKRIKNFFESAYSAGIYTIAFGTQAPNKEMPKATKEIFKRFSTIKIDKNSITIPKELFEYQELLHEFRVEPLSVNKTSIIKRVLSNQNKKEQHSKEQDFLKVPVGKVGREKLYFSMGLASKSYQAFISGMTGMGKSMFLNNLILNIAKHYTAKEIELYLVDFKAGGVEFAVFKEHPNCKKLLLAPNTQSVFETLKEFIDEMQSRGELFRDNEVKDIYDYNRKNPNTPLPFRLLIIDEMQEMFGDSFKEENQLNDLLEKIAKLGRSNGLHFILTTQSLKQIKLRDNILGQIALKVSFKLSDTMEAIRVFSENKEAQTKVPKLKPYHFLYADSQKTVVAKADDITDIDIKEELKAIKKSRNKDEVLTPQVITNKDIPQMPQEEKMESTPKKSEELIYIPKYDTSEEKEILKKLKEMEAKDE